MRKALLFGITVLLVAGTAYAELQNVEVGGQVWIRGRYWSNTYVGTFSAPWETRIPGFALIQRPIGPFGTGSRFYFDDRGNSLSFVEQKTQLSVRADFTNEVAGVIRFEAYDRWGTDFRSDYITGRDFVTTTADDVEVLESYIEADQMFGTPLRARIGRQQMKYGKGWLYGDIISACVSFSYDAIRLTYANDDFEVDGWMAKLAENSPLEEDGDVDFYGIYGTYKALEPVDLSFYWTWVRDARAVNDTDLTWFPEWLENVFGLDDYDTTNLHTIGLRAFGKTGGFDYDLELAYQTGDADTVGAGFATFIYGDHKAKFDNWASDLEVGYTFDVAWKPRVFLGGAYVSGEDNRDITFLEWLSPFTRPEASVSFNRMFSQYVYSWHLDVLQELSNFHQLRGGVQVNPTDKIRASLTAAYFRANDGFDWPVYFTVGRYRVPVAPSFSFWTTPSSRDLGWSTTFWIRYDYTEDIYVRLLWEHLFTGKGLQDGNFIGRNGLDFIGGTNSKDTDYVQIETGIRF